VTISQQQRGWFRLAFAAAAFSLLVMLAPQQRAGSSRVSNGIALSPASASSSLAVRWTRWEWPAVVTHATSMDYGVWTAILPVLFIGLMAPLELAGTRLVLAGARSPLPPALPCSFQRPPPQLV
jgi:hypothetical protein